MQKGIYKRPDSPYWWGTWTAGGATTRRSLGIKVCDDPQGIQAAAERERLIAAEQASQHIKTWDMLVNRYLDGPELELAPGTQDRHRYALLALSAQFSGKALDGINGASVRAYIALRKEQGLSDGTIGNEIALMSSITNWGISELEWSIPNPWSKRKPRKTAPRARWLTKEEADGLIAAADGYVKDFIQLILATGLRPGEALALEWRRVDFEAGAIRFDSGHGPGGQKSGKAGQVPLNHAARAVLIARKNSAQSAQWVFPSDITGGHLTDISKAFETAVQRAGLTDVHMHDLRRTAGSWLAQAGVPIQQIAGLLRHGDIALTHSTYAHLAPSNLADAAGVLDVKPKLRIVK